MMPRQPLADLATVVREEIRRGKIAEGYISDPAYFVAGLTEGDRVTVNPIPDKADIIIHEMLHRHYPRWSERYVKQRTTAIMRHLGDAGIRRLCRLYDRVVTHRAAVTKTED